MRAWRPGLAITLALSLGLVSAPAQAARAKAAPQLTASASSTAPKKKPKNDPEEDAEPAEETKTKAAKAAADEEEAGEGEGEGEGAEVEAEEEEAPKKSKKKKHRRADDEGDEGEGGAWLALRTLELVAGLEFMARSFAFNQGPPDPTLQGYSSSLSPGFVLRAESYPFATKEGALAKLGVAFSLGLQPFTKAKLGSDNLSVIQRRFALDVRYALKIGDSLLVTPMVGVGQTYFAIADKEIRLPSMCVKGDSVICVTDSIVLHAKVGADARFAISHDIALLGGVAIMPGLSVASGDGQIANDEAEDSTYGFGGELGMAYRVGDSLAVRASFVGARFVHKLTTPDTVLYTGANDTYYGITLGAMYMMN